MTAYDLRPIDQRAAFKMMMKNRRNVCVAERTFLHCDKKGNEFYIIPVVTETIYKERKGLVVQAIDAAEQETQKKKNKLLQERDEQLHAILKAVAWRQSHELRSKIANIKGMMQLYRQGLFTEQEFAAIAALLEKEIDIADEMIHDTVQWISRLTA